MTPSIRFTPLGIVQMIMAGLLMGLANLVPGVSGGTMVLVMGLYDEFVSSVADVTRLRLRKRPVLFLAIVGTTAIIAIGWGAEFIERLVTNHRGAMWALFIGLTLGGAPLLWTMISRWRGSTLAAALCGFLVVGAMGLIKMDKPDDPAAPVAERHIPLDLTAGVLGVAAMVLPGISGAYMLLLIGRYESTISAVRITKDYVASGGAEGSLAGLEILVPVNIGSILGIVAISNLLKWLLEKHEQPTLGFLFGILLGSVIGLWPFFEPQSGGAPIGLGLVLIGIGFVVTWMLSRITGSANNVEPTPA